MLVSMRIDAPSPIQLQAFAATILGNLALFAAWVAERSAWLPFQGAIRRNLNAKLRRGFQACVRIAFLLAVHRIEPPPPRTRAPYPANTPPGFRLHAARSGRRFLRLSGLNQGSIKARIARLKRMLENLEQLATRFLKRLRNRNPRLSLVLAQAIAESVAKPARALAPRRADTS
jgi:hypothetical protein